MLKYLYDDSGIIGMVYDGTTYYFHRNIQGDVVGVYNSAGTKLVTFTYDAYGNCTVSGDTSLAYRCKIRYRGYYFDTETGLYWVQTRYYNPEWCRWISPDSLSYLDTETAHGLNLYAYCGNDPVNFTDPSGHDSLPNWVMWLIGGIVILGLGIATIASGGAAGGVAGFILAGAFKGAAIGAVSGALVGGTVGGISSVINGENFWSGFADGAAHGFMSGAIVGGITGAISSGAQVAKAASCWDKGTFSSGYRSMKYHYAQEVVNKGLTKGNSIVRYTRDAMNFANNNGVNFTLNLSRNGLQNSWSLGRAFGSGVNGLYTSAGKIITFHYFYMW